MCGWLSQGDERWEGLRGAYVCMRYVCVCVCTGSDHVLKMYVYHSERDWARDHVCKHVYVHANMPCSVHMAVLVVSVHMHDM
jgi:hypothetical protein